MPVNPRNYRNFKRADIMVSLAGIVTNFVIALLCTVLIPLPYFVEQLVPAAGMGAGVVQVMLYYGVMINLVLAAFNLIPIPPLDGSHVFKYILPPAWALSYQRLGRYGLFLIFGLLMFDRGGAILGVWFAPAYHLQDWLLDRVGQYLLPWAIRYLNHA